MVQITTWIETFSQALDRYFGNRVWFMGLQGSYGREEATENSDIDMVVILDELSASDLQAYHEMLDTLPHRELICGFLSGKAEILNWDAADLFQFYYDTKPIRGSLDSVLAMLDKTAVKRVIKTGACNLYHSCVHNMLYEKSEEILKGLYKAAFFVVQAICFLETGTYVSRQKELLNKVSLEERKIIENCIRLKNGGEVDFSGMSEALFTWAKKWISKV